MIMNLQLFAVYTVNVQFTNGMYYLSQGNYKARAVSQSNMNGTGTFNWSINNIKEEELYEFKEIIKAQAYQFPVEATITESEAGTYSLNITVTNQTQNVIIFVTGAIKHGLFDVIEPVTITINKKKTELLPTIRVAQGKTGAYDRIVNRDPYELEMNDAVKYLVKQGILVEHIIMPETIDEDTNPDPLQ